ncbi:hypothetical protein, partial [Paracoccus siganidrum]
NTFFAKSSPTVIISDMTALLCGSLQTHLGTQMPSGGGHSIREDAGRARHEAEGARVNLAEHVLREGAALTDCLPCF